MTTREPSAVELGPKSPTDLERRDILKLGLTGAAVSLIGQRTFGAAQEARLAPAGAADDEPFNAWFVLHHKYTRQAWSDREALERFAKDCGWAARRDVRLLILEDYHRNYPEYLSFWSWKNLAEMLRIAHGHGMKVLPYTSPSGIDISSDFYRFHGDECAVRIPDPIKGEARQWSYRSSPKGDPYWGDYRGTPLIWVVADPATAWRDYYLETCEGLLEFGFDGIYIDQYQHPVESVDHPEVNEAMVAMLEDLRRLVKGASADNVICANVMGGWLPGKVGEEFVRRTRIADYGLSESANWEVDEFLKQWEALTQLKFFVLSHGGYESHKRKLEAARRLGQPFCVLFPKPLDEVDEELLSLYETAARRPPLEAVGE